MGIDLLKLLLLILIASFISCNTDISQATIKGFVYDKQSDKPIANCIIKIENAYYDGGDYDSFSGIENYEIQTDNEGFYSIQFDKSAYVQIDVEKDGYKSQYIDKYLTKETTELIFKLDSTE